MMDKNQTLKDRLQFPTHPPLRPSLGIIEPRDSKKMQFSGQLFSSVMLERENQKTPPKKKKKKCTIRLFESAKKHLRYGYNWSLPLVVKKYLLGVDMGSLASLFCSVLEFHQPSVLSISHHLNRMKSKNLN